MEERPPDHAEAGAPVDGNSDTNPSPSKNVDLEGDKTESTQPSASPTSLAQNPQLKPLDIPTNIASAEVQSAGPFSSWSVGSEKQLGYASPGANDRVFPIASVVSVDVTQTPFLGPSRTSGEHDYFPRITTPGSATDGAGQGERHHQRASSASNNEHASKLSKTPPKAADPLKSGIRAARGVPDHHEQKKERQGSSSTTRSAEGIPVIANHMKLFSDISSEKSGNQEDVDSINSDYKGPQGLSTGSRASMDNESSGGLYTARFKHIVTDGGHAVITGRDGDTLQRCEDEPIHIPGAVQSFGLLVALREENEGQLVVRVVSENSHRIIGFTPAEMFNLNSFTDILSEEQTDNLLDHIDFIRDEDADPATNGPEVFTISVRTGRKRTVKLWCAMHINPTLPDFLICEFELDDDQDYPLVPASESPESPEDTINSQPSQEEFQESTRIMSKPLRVLRSARKKKGEAAAMEVFNIMSQVQEQLASAPTLEHFLKILVGVVKELTGFHRVMIYQFDSTFNGRVVTELVDPRATRDLYKGLNFPASDIPKQARELYKINKVRLLYDRDLPTARLVCRTVEDLETPLDLTFSYLRAMSPIHIKYLANMAVRSSMSISINAFGELWGLIACHSYGPKGTRVSFPIRKMCRLVGDTASRNIERLSYASRLQARKLINTVPSEANPSGYIIASSDDLLTLFDADFGLLSIKGETKILGKLEHSQEALAMLEYLRLRNITSVVTSQDVKVDFPDLRYPPGFSVIAGLLLVPLSVGGADFIVFFRKGQIKEVKWAGNPYEKFIKEGSESYLEPRKSFKVWRETVVGKCREWTEEQIETAAVLCLVYGKFIEVWRQKEAALQSSQLTRLLLANSAHEVRTPLNAIINYLEIALEGTLDNETRENLAKSHSASKSLIYVINDLLDLTRTEEGQELIRDDVFDFPATIREATMAFNSEARRKGLAYEVIEHPGIPQFVHGDQRRVRQVVANITANAMQNTTSGEVRVELFLASREEQRVTIDIMIQDTGAGMPNAKLDALFRELEQVTADDDEDFANDEKISRAADTRKERTLGLGLAVVARIVRNMQGQLRLKSEEGKGSRFVIQLPFDISDDDEQSSRHSSDGTTMATPTLLATQSTPPLSKGEVLLVDKASSAKSAVISRRNSLETASALSFRSGSSGRSFKSGSAMSNRSNRSGVERLIDALSEPLAVDRRESDHHPLQRSNSKGSGNSKLSAGNITHGATVPTRSHTNHERATTSSVPRSYAADLPPTPGTENVTDNKTPIRAVRMPEEFEEEAAEVQHSTNTTSRVTFNTSDSGSRDPSPKMTSDNFQVLVAEDDPVNTKIVQKRLEKSGHKVFNTVNGEDCASAYCEKPSFFDVVLMDMQMPIVDGLTSTKMIRSFEKSHLKINLSNRASVYGRIPIVAVSASLVERERQTYIDAGFDAWILKPIDFKRLTTILTGIVDEEVRNNCLYQSGQWERGGWFERRLPDVFQANTVPSETKSVASSPNLVPELAQSDLHMIISSSSPAHKTKHEPRRPLIHDERLESESTGSNVSSETVTDREMDDVSDKPDEQVPQLALDYSSGGARLDGDEQ